jgi:hypothetical protein
MFDLLISIVTIVYMQLLSRKIKFGLYVGLLAQALWLVYIVVNNAWGLLLLNISLWYICIMGIKNWDK